jgi:hypothetical protein
VSHQLSVHSIAKFLVVWALTLLAKIKIQTETDEHVSASFPLPPLTLPRQYEG